MRSMLHRVRTASVTLAFAALGVLGAPQAAQANLVVNGSFEVDPFTNNGNYELGLLGNDVTGWFIPNGDGTYPWGVRDGAFGAATPFGIQWVVLGLWSTGVEYTIQQTINGLVVGDSYDLSFAIASEQGCCSQAEVSFLSGSPTAAQTFAAPSSGSYWTDWATHSMQFVASSSSVTLQFKNKSPSANGLDLGLDDVVVIGASANVPEPGSLVLLAAAALGFAAIRRRRSR